MSKTKLNILFLSQEDMMILDMIAYSLQDALDDVTIGVFEAQTQDDALEILHHNSIDLIIADMNIDSLESYKFYDHLQEIHQFDKIPFVFLSSDPEDQEIAVLKGLHNFFLKPLNVDELLESAGAILKKQTIHHNEALDFLNPDMEIDEIEQEAGYDDCKNKLIEISKLSSQIDQAVQNNDSLQEIQIINDKIKNLLN
jgi:DNA-binding response OmpR family regulator